METQVTLEQFNDRLSEAVEALNDINNTLRELNNLIAIKR